MTHLLKTLIIIELLFTSALKAEDKKPLTFENMTSWESIKSRKLSNDAHFVIYETAPLRGDSKTIITSTASLTSDTLHSVSKSKISAAESFIVARLKAPYDSIRQKKIEKVDAKKMPKDSVIIYSLEEHKVAFTFPQVKSYKVSTYEGNYAAILLDKKAFKKKKAEKDSTSMNAEGAIPDSTLAKAAIDSLPHANKIAKALGNTLVTYNGTTHDTTVYNSITDYSISKNGASLAFVQAFEDSLDYTEVFFLYTNDDVAISVFKATGEVKSLTLSEDGKQLAFLYSDDTAKMKQYELKYSNDMAQAQVLVDSTTIGMPNDWNVSANGKIWFDKAGSRLYMGTSKMEHPKAKDSIPSDEVPGVDVWSWTDLRLQPQQLVEAEKDKKKTYTAVFDLKEERFTQLGNMEYDSTTITKDGQGDYVLLRNNKPYLRASNWTGRWSEDIAIKRISNNKVKTIAQDVLSARLSPNGDFVLWFNDQDTSLYCYSIAEASITRLNEDIPYPIYNELDDRPAIPNPYGLMGWAKNDKYVYLYDRFDIWQVDPTGKKKSQCISNGYGRDNKLQLRYEVLDRELTYVPQEIYLYANNIENNDTYYYKTSLRKAADPEELYGGAYSLLPLSKAKNTDQVIWGKMTVDQYPDICLSGLDFSNEKMISAMNPQQQDYNWASVETTEWTSFTGETLKGLIYKPENFDPTKKYPVLFYFYELNFDTQHRYFAPSPSRSIINRTFYASNGYIVFVPDITYSDGYPGQSAYNAIVSGAQSLVERYPWVDAQHMALSGQSWGGYQTAYLITQTDMFAAAMGGAVVSNMTSAYGGIRWGTGVNRMFQYEKTQSRIGGTLWEKPMQYIENSPLFYAPKVNTPLLMMHNDKDTAVPWYQGIEYFTALRRLDKPVWMLNYNNEPHNLKASSIANRLDLSQRMKQFFDHYLKDSAAPEWMTKGVPAVEKGENLGY